MTICGSLGSANNLYDSVLYYKNNDNNYNFCKSNFCCEKDIDFFFGLRIATQYNSIAERQKQTKSTIVAVSRIGIEEIEN